MKKTYKGNILKMKGSILSGGVVRYDLPIGEDLLHMNDLIGKKISLEYSGIINDIETGEKITKSYNQGYSYKSFLTLAKCDRCIMNPELCHYSKGTCREPKWGEENCFIPHIVYLANTTAPKVGITRESQVPTRWIDQGATQAIEVVRVNSRKESGLVEVFLKNFISDKTNWRKMLQSEGEELDLEYLRDEMLGHLEASGLDYEERDGEVQKIEFPVMTYPKKLVSLGFDKKSHISGVLLGIKGQYLIFDIGVLNIRKHQGYFIEVSEAE